MIDLHRRSFLRCLSFGPVAAACAPAAAEHLAPDPVRPIVVASGNGLRAVERAMDLLRNGAEPCDAVVSGVGIIEADPEDMSVGKGGLPNADGVVQLDASVMDGRFHRAGAVGGLERITHAAAVALDVLRHTDHVMLVGDGARRFAVERGYPEEDLLTEKARAAWNAWKTRRDAGARIDFAPLDAQGRAAPGGTPFTHGTIHCAAIDAKGDIGACTTTSGRSWKLPGRVGDSPIIGAGLYVDNEVGAAGGTGRGEAAMQSCGAHAVVEHMRRGDDPTIACLKTMRTIASNTRRLSLLDGEGRPNFGLVLYALRRDGAFGGASMRGKRTLAVHDGTAARIVECARLFG